MIHSYTLYIVYTIERVYAVVYYNILDLLYTI